MYCLFLKGEYPPPTHTHTRARLLVIFDISNVIFFSGPKALPHTKCERTWEKVGCFKEISKNGRRTLPVLLVNDRDPKSKAYDGHRIDWHAYEESMHRYICLLLVSCIFQYNIFQIKGWRMVNAKRFARW